jgi:hypothetical protein
MMAELYPDAFNAAVAKDVNTDGVLSAKQTRALFLRLEAPIQRALRTFGRRMPKVRKKSESEHSLSTSHHDQGSPDLQEERREGLAEAEGNKVLQSLYASQQTIAAAGGQIVNLGRSPPTQVFSSPPQKQNDNTSTYLETKTLVLAINRLSTARVTSDVSRLQRELVNVERLTSALKSTQLVSTEKKAPLLFKLDIRTRALHAQAIRAKERGKEVDKASEKEKEREKEHAADEEEAAHASWDDQWLTDGLPSSI